MAYTTLFPSGPNNELSDVRGTHYDRDSGFLYFVSQGKIYRAPTAPTTLIATRTGMLVTKSVTFNVNLNALSGVELNVASDTVVKGNNLYQVRFITASPTTTPEDLLAYTSANWQLVGDGGMATMSAVDQNGFDPPVYYAVRMLYLSKKDIYNHDIFHVSKVRIGAGGPNQVAIDYSTYMAGNGPVALSADLGDVRDIVVTDYESRIFMSYVDGDQGYVGYVDRGPTTTPYPSFTDITPIIDNLTNPQQIATDGHTTYVVDDTSVWRIVADSEPVKIITQLTGGMGLLIHQDGATFVAYVAEVSGQIRKINLSEFDELSAIDAPAPEHSLGVSVGFMSWADDEHTGFYVTDRTNNKIMLVDLVSGQISEEAMLDQAVPWSVEPGLPGKFFVACETQIGVYSRAMPMTPGVVALGIGLIPFDYINNAEMVDPIADTHGMANTSAAPGYYFSSYPDLPFGGSLSLMINHELAWNNGARFYRVTLKNLITNQFRTIENAFTDVIWNSQPLDGGKPRFEPKSTGGPAYPVRSPLELWYNPFLAAVIQTGLADNGHNILTIQLYDANSQAMVGGKYERLLLIDNTRYGTSIRLPRIGTDVLPPAPGIYPDLGSCGCLVFNSKDDRFELDFAAWHPQGVGSYGVSVMRGGSTIAALSHSGAVTVEPETQVKNKTANNHTLRIGHLTGDCDVANIRLAVNVGSRVINGYGWVNLGSYSERAFTIVKAPLSHTPWQDPEN